MSKVLALLKDHWGLQGELSRLPGENLNFRLESSDAVCHVLKITNDHTFDPCVEEAVLERLRSHGIPVPNSIPTTDGSVMVDAKAGESSAIARVQSFLQGTLWRDVEPSPKRLYAIGVVIAHMHAALDGIDEEHPGLRRTHQWDLTHAGKHRSSISMLESEELRRASEHAFHLHASCAAPFLMECPQGVLHGDVTDENILFQDDSISGVLDLGDSQTGAYVLDIAISIAYALQHEGVGLDMAAELVAGYESVRELEPIERSVLFPLVLARLATSVCIAAMRRAENPDHENWFVHAETAASTMLSLVATPPAVAERILCGTESVNSMDTLLQRRASLLGGSLSLSYDRPLHIEKGCGQYLHAVDGRAYLDLVNNVCHVGHCHPRVVEAIAAQAAELNTNTRYLHENILLYGERLCATLPDSLDTCFFVNSGSEANELALRLARAATGANDVLVMDGAYHGNTSNCVAMSPYKFNGPGGSGQPDWVHVAPMPDRYRGELRGDDTAGGYALELARVIGEACAQGRSIGAFFAEPILSCGGQIPLPDGFLSAAFEHVRKAGGVCVVDEVQVGFGRVGEAFWGFQLHDVVPDIVVMGKPIGNGHPMGAVITTKAIAEAFDNGMEFFSTFGGNPVSCACGLAVLDVVEDEDLQERARVLGARFIEGARELKKKHELIGDVRGAGLFIGIELVRDRETLEPADTEAAAIVNEMRERGVLLSTDGPLHNVIKFKPPLVLNENDVDMTLRLLDDVLSGIR